MRTILTILAFFPLFGASAQGYSPSYGMERPRGELIAYPTQQEAATADGSDNRYLTRLAEWTRTENTFTIPFTVPFAWANRQVIFHIDSAPADYEVRINGKTVAYDNDGNTPAEINLTRSVKEGRNTLEVVVSSPSPNAPLESWKTSAANALGQTWITSQPTMRVRDLLVKTWSAGEAGGALTAEIGIVVKSDALNPRSSRIHYELLTPTGETAATGYKDVTLDMRREDTVRFLASIPAHLTWSRELPTQYTLRLKTQRDGRYEEYLEFRPGFRSAELRDGKLIINGQPLAMRAIQVSPSIGKQEIATLREQGFNTLRLLPGAVDPSLYAACDALGMYVIAQAPVNTRNSGESRRKGGNPSNDPAWRGAFIERAENSYHTAKRHPSVIAFSLADKSANGTNLYDSYLNMKAFGDARPFIYPNAEGEWNSDPLLLE